MWVSLCNLLSKSITDLQAGEKRIKAAICKVFQKNFFMKSNELNAVAYALLNRPCISTYSTFISQFCTLLHGVLFERNDPEKVVFPADTSNCSVLLTQTFPDLDFSLWVIS